MASKAKFEKSIKISNKPGTKDKELSLTLGGKLDKIPKPKSLTPKAKLGKK